LKITFIAVGGIKKSYIKEGFEDYLGRIKRYAKTSSIEVKEERGTKSRSRAAALKKEAERVLKSAPGGFKVVLDERGKALTSRELSGLLKDLQDRGCKDLYLIVGGPYGLGGEVAAEADLLISLSPMTLPHELTRLMLAEQIYRAFTIMKGEPYSH
jgi:23S rRNA (pseudouridine1915-N3)-methyltransferase